MSPTPPYDAAHLTSAYQLRYVWRGWPSKSVFPSEPDADFFEDISQEWEGDGIRLLEHTWTDDRLICLASVTPEVSPIFFTARMKGRLQHKLRKYGTPVAFSRMVGMSTVGDASRSTVEKYIHNQVAREPLVDPKFKDFLREFSVVSEDSDPGEPVATRSGRYWYNLHLVLVTRERSRLVDRESLATLRDASLCIAETKGYRISALSVMPDHLHVALRGNIDHSPEEIALAFMNNLAHILGHAGLWKTSFYVGTFGEYDMWAIRQVVQSTSPAS